MIKIFAPDVASRIVIMMPDPEWGDVQRLESTLQLYRSMNDAKKITHIRKMPDVRTYELTFLLTRLKALEFINFFERFGAERIRIELDKDTSRVGYLKVNPTELEYTKRAVSCNSLEEVLTRFDFENIPG